MTTRPQGIIVTDANVLINLMHVGRLELCGRLPNLKFVIPDHVREEIVDIAQRAEIDDAIARGDIHMESITTPNSIALYAELVSHIGRGRTRLGVGL